MIGALAILSRVTGTSYYLSAAEKAQQFVEKYLTDGNLLFVGCRSHIRSAKGFLDEYAYYGAALLLLYEASGKDVYLERAGQICGEAFRQFTDERNGGYFLCGLENETLVMKPKETYDGALPSGNSVMAYCLVRLFQITGDGEYGRLARRQLVFLSGEAEDYPAGHGMFLLSAPDAGNHRGNGEGRRKNGKRQYSVHHACPAPLRKSTYFNRGNGRVFPA